jgi:three-Cys-motif partner protein
LKAHYDYTNGVARLEQHSIAKHDLLRAYLCQYFPTLVSSPHQDELKLTIVDGFAGGGLYQHADTKEIVPGSPLICLEAAAEAEYLINLERNKKIAFNIDFIFVEKKKTTSEFLKSTLKNKGYTPRISKDIHVLEGDFNDHADAVIAQVKRKTPKSGRAIFILDQYGYKQVPMPLLARIFQTLPRAEVILTFNVDSFSTYATDKAERSILEDIGLPNIFGGRKLEDIKANERDWRAFIQSQLYPHIVKAAGSRFHTPFFIRSTKGHGDFWLLHLSMHQKARDVMTEVHWANSNTFIHYGGEGLDMFKLGYIVKADEIFTQQNKLGFTFDDDAKERTIKKLSEDIPHLIHADDDGQSFESLWVSTCNDTPATSRIVKEVLSLLAKHGQVEITSPEGVHKHSANQIKSEDRIRPPRQRTIFS